MDQTTLFLYNTHIRWRPFLAHFRENFGSLKITNYPGLIPFFQPGKLFRGQKCLSTNFRAKKIFFQKNFRDFDENAHKSYFIFCVFQTHNTLRHEHLLQQASHR